MIFFPTLIFQGCAICFSCICEFSKIPFLSFFFSILIPLWSEKIIDIISVFHNRVWPVTRGRTLNLKTKKLCVGGWGGGGMHASWYTCGHSILSGGPPLLPCLRQGLLFASWPVIVQGFSCLCQPPLVYTCTLPYLAFYMFWGYKIRSSCLCGVYPLNHFHSPLSLLNSLNSFHDPINRVNLLYVL